MCCNCCCCIIKRFSTVVKVVGKNGVLGGKFIKSADIGREITRQPLRIYVVMLKVNWYD